MHISKALQRLTPRERLVFELKHFEGLKLQTVSEMLRMTVLWLEMGRSSLTQVATAGGVPGCRQTHKDLGKRKPEPPCQTTGAAGVGGAKRWSKGRVSAIAAMRIRPAATQECEPAPR